MAPLPDDTYDSESIENPLTYTEFLRIPKFTTVNIGMVMTLNTNLFMLTGIIFGINYFPGCESHMTLLIGFNTFVYGIGMYVLS